MPPQQKKISRYPSVTLNNGREQSLLRKHPWLFSGAIKSRSGKLFEGEPVEVFDAAGNYTATGFWENGSIAAKLISFEQREINQDFWVEKLSAAWKQREILGLTDDTETNAWRLVFAEGDGLPGLILDYYNGLVVFLAQSLGMYKSRQEIALALKLVLGEKLLAVYDKSIYSRKEEMPPEQLFLTGTSVQNPVLISENGYSFIVDYMFGQKTGFFLDQRENRFLVGKYANGKKVLNLFSYTGGFSVYALKNGARSVFSVDSSANAVEMAQKNVVLNCPELSEKHQAVVADVKDYLQEMESDFELIILDPPAFAKHKESRHKAILGYKYLNYSAIKKIANGGLLFTFSCSQLVTPELFESMALSAALDAGRQVKIIHRLSQPADHPVSIFHPEGSYLKGLVLYVE